MSTSTIETPLTEAQEREIRAQAAFYDTDDCPGCESLSHWRAYRWDDEIDGGSSAYPQDAVAVDFTYVYEDGAHGLETTVFAASGEVLDSQDFG